MDQLTWILWVVLGIGFIVAEVFTLGFVLLWFGIGALAAALVGILGLGIVWQIMVFIVVSAVLTGMSRTIFAKYLQHGEGSRMKSGVEALPGKIGTVTASSKGALSEGAVKVFGSTWTAFPIDGEKDLAEGEKVEVVEVKGSSLFVRRVTNELPEWRNND